jgi:hypothetical protein
VNFQRAVPTASWVCNGDMPTSSSLEAVLHGSPQAVISKHVTKIEINYLFSEKLGA